ncbi:MAG TPA: hypothetical protein DEV93_12265 [Chloroflexi bacterium]|nr:hypothetical protein [Chloroflexota bacterium]
MALCAAPWRSTSDGKSRGRHSAMADKHGQSTLYHDTLTRAWLYLVAAAMTDYMEVSDFDEFLRRHPELLDKNCLLRYYSAEQLSSAQARSGWLSPDLHPIPGAPGSARPQVERQGTTEALSVPAEEFRLALQCVPRPVAVMTARDATRVHGTTVGSVAPVSTEPAQLFVSVRRDSRILEIVRASRGFGVSYLGKDQESVAIRFSDQRRGEGAEQFRDIPHVVGRFGAPIITGGPLWFECRLRDEYAAENHQVILGIVIAEAATDTEPWQRFRGVWA